MKPGASSLKGYVYKRVALGPAEVAVLFLADRIGYMYQESSDSVELGGELSVSVSSKK